MEQERRLAFSALFYSWLGGFKVYKVYRIFSKSTGESFIGSTVTSLEQRWVEHCSDSRCGKYAGKLMKALGQMGTDNFGMELLEEVPFSDVRSREYYWLRHFDAIERGYNTIPVRLYLIFDVEGEYVCEVDSVRGFAKEVGVSDKSFRDVLSGKQAKAGKYLIFYKEEFTPEKLKEAYLRVRGSSQLNTSKPFAVFRDGKFIQTFESRSACAKEYGLLPQKIGLCLSGNLASHRGYTFSYVKPKEV